MTPEIASDVLALVEERPYATDELAALLGVPADTLHRELLAMARAGQLKRAGAEQKWALPTEVLKAGAPPSVDRAGARDAIRQALAEAMLATGQLRARTGFTRHVILDECTAMQAAGELTVIGRHSGARWALPGYVPPAKATSHVCEICRAGFNPKATNSGRFCSKACFRVFQQRRTAALQASRPVHASRPRVDGAGQGGAPVSPRTRPVDPDVPPSWWVNKSRDELAAAVETELPRMLESKFGHPTGRVNFA